MDCGHQYTFSDEKMHNPDEKRYPNNLYCCDKCANGDRSGVGDYGFPTQSVFHSVVVAAPMFSPHLKELQRQQQQEQGV